MHKRLVRLSALAAGAVFVFASCGGSASPSSAAARSNTTTTTAGNSTAKQSAFRECLSKQGVTLPAGFGDRGRNGGAGAGGNGAPPAGGSAEGGPPEGGQTRGSLPAGQDDKFQRAMQACGNLAPAGGFGRDGGNRNPEALKAYTSCLSDHGVTVPTTTSGAAASGGAASGATGARPGGELGKLRADPKFAAANKICRPLLPTFGSTTTTTTQK